jgi:hypothetical protein
VAAFKGKTNSKSFSDNYFKMFDDIIAQPQQIGNELLFFIPTVTDFPFPCSSMSRT